MNLILKIAGICFLSFGLLHGQAEPGWAQPQVSPQRALDLLANPASGRSAPAISNNLAEPLTDAEAAESLAKSQPLPTVAAKTFSALNITPGGNEADFITPEIESLAIGLRNDPVKIFEYVHNFIRYEAYFGSKKGAHLTLLEGAGNEHDQSALLVALLRAAGLNPSYKYGPCIFSYSQMASWYGLSADAYSHWTDAQLIAYYYPTGGAPAGFPTTIRRQHLTIITFLSERGYPYIEEFAISGIAYYSIPHVWVELDGKRLSPSYKFNTIRVGIDLAAAAGYSRSQVLADVGGTVNTGDGTRWVSGLNYSALSDRLKLYTQNFIQSVKTNYDSLHSDRITESTAIIKASYTSLDGVKSIAPDSFAAGDWLPFETWSAIPVAHMSKLEIRGGVWNKTTEAWTSLQYNNTINLPALRGRKLSLIKHANGAIIYLDETPLGSVITMPGSQTSLDLELKVTHNHYELTYNGSAYTITKQGITNQKENKNYKIDTESAYALIYCFSNPDQVMRARQEQLENYQRAGLTDSDWRVKTEALNIIGLNWFYQTYQANLVASGVFQVDTINHHRFGRVGQEPSFTTNRQSSYIDVGLQFGSDYHRTSNIGETRNFTRFSTFYASAMEHGVLEQIQGSSLSGVSTIKLIYLANQAGQRLYRATGANWSAVSSELQNYPSVTTSAIGTTLNADSSSRALIPRSGKITLNQYQGFGYALHSPASVGMLIGENFGGYSSQPSPVASAPVISSNRSNPAQNSSSAPISYPYVPYTAPQRTFSDPVDVASGAWISDYHDLSLGGGEPIGLTFTRSYNSNSRYNKEPGLGFGWTHSYDIKAVQRSSVKAGLGVTNSYQAAPFFASLAVAADLSRNHNTAKEWTTAALAINWAIDQLRYKAVSITQGNKTFEFIEMPDGTFIPPSGMNLTLVRNGSGASAYYTLTKRHGATMTFLPDGKVDKITDLFGKIQQFTYTSGQLTKVKDAYNRELNFSWAGGKITAVTDTTSRSVGFGYLGDDLQTFTDAEGKTMTYGYDSEHRVKSVKDGLNRTIIENDYDTRSRVTAQRNKGEVVRTYQFFYSGYANSEENPLGGKTTYYYDERGRTIGSIDALGNTDLIGYDGQDRKIAGISPKDEISFWDYNSDNNLYQKTDPLNKITDYYYDSQLRLERINDKRGYNTTFTYNTKHQLETVTDPLLHVTTSHYLPSGLLEYTIDAESKKTTIGYDTWGQANKITYHDGKFQSMLNNARGDVLTVTDPENRTVTNTYNKRSQPLTSTLPAIIGEPNATTTNTYNDAGHLETTTDAKSNVTVFAHNVLGNRTSTTLPALPAGNNIITTTYDLRDWMDTTYNSLNHTVTTEYDAAKRPNASIDPLSRRTEIEYDPNGQVTETKDPLSRTNKQFWNARGEKAYTTDALTKYTDFIYDNNGNLEDLFNRRGKQYSYYYDDANRQYLSATPTLKFTSTTYFDNNLVKTITEHSNQTTTFTYNARNLVESKIDPVGTTTYGYDDSTLLKTVTEGGAVINRTYDERGRLNTFTTADGDLIQYKYDANNNLTRITYPPEVNHPAGKQVNYTYNSRNLLETVTDWSNRVTTYTYDRLGRLTGTIRPNGTANQIAHDAASQLTSIKESSGGKLISYLAFQYDAASQIKSRFRAPLVNSGWQHPTFTATYDDDNRLLTANGSSVVHDGDGNMTSGPITSTSGTVSLGYNSRNQLINAAGTFYIYDAEGRRRSFTDAAGTTRDIIDPSGRLLIRISPGGAKTYYVYGLGLLYEADQADATKTYHFDQVGSTIARTDDTGKVIGRAEYSAYGITFWKEGDMATPFLYNGQAGVQTDSNGLLNMRARYYSPYLMRFLNADPIGFSGGPNWFAYADGNPISLNDPFGLEAQGGFMGNLSAGVGFLMDGVANAMMNVPQGMAWTSDQAHHVLNGNFSSLGSSSYNGGMIEAMEGMKNPYGNQGYYNPNGMAPVVRDNVIGAAAIVYGVAPRGGSVVAKGTPKWPKTAQEMDDFLKVPGQKLPDGPTTLGRDKTVWRPNKDTKITLEQHPYDTTAPDWHKGPHWHLDTPGIKPHQRYVPGDDVPGY